VSRAAIARERRREDEALQDQRAAADESLRREREETAGALTRLLPLERERTDRFLLTERVRSDEAVSQRDDFLGMVSHDLRDLLGGIVMSASLLAASVGDSDEGQNTLLQTERIKRYAARMNRLIGDLVDVASIDAGKLAMIPAAGDGAALVTEAVDTFRAAASAKGVSLESDVSGPLPADFDHGRMLQVFANLITNALKFTPPGGAIRVHGEQVGTGVRFSVRDTGIGIPAHLLETIFERFWQVGTNEQRGLGLGLHISRKIVEAHGGRVWAESRDGAGSTFHVTLPGQNLIR
jgi:signal transduction histidine kinase